MAKRILFIILLIALLMIPIIIADNSIITIKTRPYYKVLVSVFKAGITPPEKIISFPPYKNTGPAGQLSVSLVTTEKKVDIKLDLKKDDTPIITKDFYDVGTGEPIYINLFPPDNMTVTIGNPVVNATESNITNLSSSTNTTVNTSVNATIKDEKTIKSNFSITGYIAKFYENNSKTLLYILIIIGVLIGVLIIIFIIRKIPKKSHNAVPRLIYHKTHEESADKSLAEAEKKLRIAQEEIEKIKNRNQSIRDAERKLEEDRIRLEKLRRGY